MKQKTVFNVSKTTFVSKLNLQKKTEIPSWSVSKAGLPVTVTDFPSLNLHFKCHVTQDSDITLNLSLSS